MNGRVLSDTDLRLMEDAENEWILVNQLDTTPIANLIATIRDREEMVGSWRRVCEKLEQQNTIFREALEEAYKHLDSMASNRIEYDPATVYMAHALQTRDMISEALAKVSQKEVSTPDEPNRNA